MTLCVVWYQWKWRATIYVFSSVWELTDCSVHRDLLWKRWWLWWWWLSAGQERTSQQSLWLGEPLHWMRSTEVGTSKYSSFNTTWETAKELVRVSPNLPSWMRLAISLNMALIDFFVLERLGSQYRDRWGICHCLFAKLGLLNIPVATFLQNNIMYSCTFVALSLLP